jgi:phospholipid/cholesterol/gamma-HCH transport system substrate-binding protein
VPELLFQGRPVPSQKEVKWSQLKVGVLVIVALAALVALVFLMSGSSGGLQGKLTIRSYFENSAGLKLGAPVNLEGVTIGNVRSMRIVPDRNPTPVEVTMKLSQKYASAMHSDSKASLETVGVLGDTVVDISSKDAKGGPLLNGAELQTTETPNLTDVIKSSQGTIEQINTILAKLNTLIDSISGGKGSIGQLINNPDLYNKFVATLTQLNQVTQKISSGQGSIGKLVNDDAFYDRANQTMGRLQHITDDLDQGKGSAGKLLKDDTLYRNLNSTVANANQLLADINAGKGGLGKLAKDEAFAQKLDDTVTRLDSILKNVDEGKGTLGQFVNNPSLYNNSDQLLVDTRSLITSIRQNPKKYLTFHVKIF